MKKLSIIFFIAAFAAVIISFEGCSPNSSIPSTPLKSGEMETSVSPFGQFFASNTTAIDGPTTYFIAASIKDQAVVDSVVIHILLPKQAITPYSVDIATDPVAVMDYCITTNSGCITYQAKQGVGTGSIRITDVSSTAIQGTFSGTLPAEAGSGSVTISGGSFNASF